MSGAKIETYAKACLRQLGAHSVELLLLTNVDCCGYEIPWREN